MSGGRVFTLGISGIFSAHDLATGKLLWRKNAPPTPPEFGTASSPMVDGANVIAFLGGTGAGALTAMDAATGAVKWRWTGDGPGYSSPILVTIGGMRQIITQSQNKLVGVAAADGRLLWEVPIKTPYEQNSVTPLVVNDVVISAGLDNPTIAFWITAGLGKGWSATPRVEQRPGVDVHELAGRERHDDLRTVEQEPRPVLRDRCRDRQDAVARQGTRSGERVDRPRRQLPACCRRRTAS